MRFFPFSILILLMLFGCAPKERSYDPRQCLHIFSDLFIQFRQDAQKAGSPNEYPNELKDFVKSGYISSADFLKITRGLRLFYINPSKSKRSDIVLAVFLDRDNQLSLFGQLRKDFSYDMYIETRTFLQAEQGAAANP